MMDKSCQSSADSTTTTSSGSTTTNTNTTQYLKHLNKLSHKISKPVIKKPPFDQTPNQNLNPNPNPNPNPQQSQPPQIQQQQQQQQQAQQQQQQQAQQQQQQQQQQHQPPVYNINKNDFRDVVQKLTGSPAHERFSTPPPIHAPKPPSSRLQRIRPPPLAQLSNRPPPLLNNAASAAVVPIPNNNSGVTNSGVHVSHHHHNNNNYGRPVTPLSPLPPFPTVHATAESPISAYMRYLQNPISGVDSNPKQFSGFSPLAPRFSPRWNTVTPPQPQLQHQFPPPPQPQPQQHQGMLPPPPPATMASQSQSQFLMPTSPLPFGCLNSPKSPYPLLSPSLLFSPSSGQLGFPQLPLSPTVPLPSPRWRAL